MSWLVFCEEKGSDVTVIIVEAPSLVSIGAVSTTARLTVVVVVVVVMMLPDPLLEEL